MDYRKASMGSLLSPGRGLILFLRSEVEVETDMLEGAFFYNRHTCIVPTSTYYESSS